ncbi:MAG: hypothetical protein LBG20_03870 [Holosporaceae bacterium]|jgi:hypothetical protein|nr:hypothetical protein [Holosporaceae bacterium]
MKLLQKILMIVICVIFFEPVNCMLDFDTIATVGTSIPSQFQPKWNDSAINANPPGVVAPNGIYVYFTVIPNGGIAAVANVNFAPLNLHVAHPVAAAVPVAGDTNIYFPEDGHQPTTQEAVEYSCATVNDPRIIEWYVAMFGGSSTIGVGANAVNFNQAGGIDIKAGFGNAPPGGGNQPRQKIILLDASMTHVGCCRSCSYDYHDNFWNLFRQVAANPVGRILLYRLLIEIRRIDNTGDGIAEVTLGIRPSAIRNRSRRISVIRTHGNEWNFFPDGRIEFADNNNSPIPTVIDRNRTALKKRELCIAMFHEMLHWYHCLRDTVRMNVENPHDLSANLNNPILNYYFGGVNPNTINNTWNQDNQRVAIEDMRTILGVTPGINGLDGNPINNFLNGDDLSENLFRCALNYQNIAQRRPRVYMRYGGSIIIHDVGSLNVIVLAHNVAFTTMSAIVINAAGNWTFVKNGAISP